MKKKWLTSTILGIALTSLFSDLSHEAATAVLPAFLATLGAAPATLGIIEGTADAISSFAKLGSGWFSDGLEKRKPLAVIGYALTAAGTSAFALATSWLYVLLCRTGAWFGRGIRGPVRDALMTDNVDADSRGKAFGFERAMDTMGAVLGPAVALVLVGIISYRQIFLLALIPGMLAVFSFAFLVREAPKTSAAKKKFLLSLSLLPKDYKRYLAAVGTFGIGDFSHTLLILRATQILSSTGVENPARIAVALYVLHNIVYAAASYPAGALGDRFGKKGFLALGYAVAGLMCAGFLLPFASPLWLGILFALGGVYVAIQDSLEKAIAADYLPSDLRGTGFGALATVNGLGDFASSIVVGLLWTTVGSSAGFMFAMVLTLAGATLIMTLPSLKSVSAAH